MPTPCCPVCQSFRNISQVSSPRRVICLECGARWSDRPEDRALRYQPISPSHPAIQRPSSR